MIEGLFPMADRQRPSLRRLLNCHVHDLQSRLLVGIDLSIPRELPDYTVHRLDGIRGVDHLANRPGKIEQRDDVGPLGAPRLGDCRIFRVPSMSKFVQRLLGLDDGRRQVDFFQVGDHRFAVLSAHVP